MSLLDGLGSSQILLNGVALTKRGVINFLGAVGSVVDDPANKRTNITLGGGGGGGATDSDGVANKAVAVSGATVTDALVTLWNAVSARATTAALNALTTVVNGKADAAATSTALSGKAPVGAEYLVRTLSSELTAERVLSGKANSGLVVDYGTADKAIIDPTSLRLPAPSYTGATVTPITGTVDKDRFEATGLPLTAADVGRFIMATDGTLYMFTDYQLTMADEAP